MPGDPRGRLQAVMPSDVNGLIALAYTLDHAGSISSETTTGAMVTVIINLNQEYTLL